MKTFFMRTYLFLLALLPFAVAQAQRFPIGIVSSQDTVKHVQVGLISSIATGASKGVQLSTFTNMSAGPLKGIQLSGLSNITRGMELGIQFSSLLNVSSDYMRGLQLGAANYADSLSGTQIGLINVALSHPKGWQVGVVNITRDTIAHKLGLVNVNPNTTIDYLFYAGTASKGNVGIRYRNRSTYSIIGVGTHYMGLDKKFSGALTYRIGQYFMLSPRFSLSGDVGFQHIETFEHESAGKPERLYSLQVRVNADYQLTKRLGVFATLGYGDTRHYHHSKRYRQRLILEGGLSMRMERGTNNLLYRWNDEEVGVTDETLLAPSPRKRYWVAAAEVTGINALVHSFDRFVMGEEFAKTTLHSYGRNLRDGFVWDNDQFSTNLFAHPYHGNLYYNSARSNGLTFWESAPYALGGSLMWEFFGEREPAAINDLMATTMGGIAIGEITHRISNVVLNDRATGFQRFLREATATLIDPMKGFNRIISGQAWRVKHDHYLYHDRNQFPIDFSLTFGNRYLADNGAMFRGEHNPFINFYLEYGDVLNRGKQNKPYDFFDAEVTFGLSKNQPFINGLHLLGRLWSFKMVDKDEIKAEFGFYQHFNYYDSKPVKEGSSLTPYRISEAASVGPGVVLSLPQVGALAHIEQRVFLSGILLGGTKSDYYNVIDRDYNMGSGFSIKTKTHLEMSNFGRFILHAKYFHLFTWKGYEQKDLSTVDLLHLNAQGDKGNARLFVISPMAEIDLRQGWSLSLATSLFYRRTHYKYYPNVKANTFEIRGGFTYHL
ncbi:MAG: DUF3943 domain-containing protein [Bacteroidaceae bacterium]|nr:DUF3943 domain-containing protein [Bacteroidaceae bacterium]